MLTFSAQRRMPDTRESIINALYRLGLLGRFNQCLAARRRLSLIGILHGDADDRHIAGCRSRVRLPIDMGEV